MDRDERRKVDALTRAGEQLRAVRAAEADLERLIARALHWGASWAETAAVLGVTRSQRTSATAVSATTRQPASPGTNHPYHSDPKLR